jgi:hypothetical protein
LDFEDEVWDRLGTLKVFKPKTTLSQKQHRFVGLAATGGKAKQTFGSCTSVVC